MRLRNGSVHVHIAPKKLNVFKLIKVIALTENAVRYNKIIKAGLQPSNSKMFG
jgi:hypothetical protein